MASDLSPSLSTAVTAVLILLFRRAWCIFIAHTLQDTSVRKPPTLWDADFWYTSRSRASGNAPFEALVALLRPGRVRP